ncbi:hypothetical protein ACRAWC_21820 [Leifsonia sp. L25]|uniref:hypothetical protein n=1 Tax=Leifsonia sp. L25 TaxID=3423957 RepID=UPI003D68B09D
MRTHGSSWTHVALYSLFAIVVAGTITTGVATATLAASCGGGQPDSVFAGLQLAMGGDPSGFSLVPGCVAPVTLIRVLDLLTVILLLSGIAVGAVWWLRYWQSDRHFINDLRGRDGLAKPGEVPQAHLRTHRSSSRQDPSAVVGQPCAVSGWLEGRARPWAGRLRIDRGLDRG